MFDFARMLKQLETGVPTAGAASPSLPWLVDSWQSPARFASSLLAFHAGRSAPPPKSRAGESYDFHHDMVARHLDSEAPMLRVLGRAGTWQSITYAQVQARSARRAGDWRTAGVKAGAAVCLCYEPGVELLVSLMSALRLGAVVTILPLGGARYLGTRIAALAPDFIAAEPHQAPLFPGYEAKLLRDGAGGPVVNESHTYAAGDPVARCLSPRHDPPHLPLPLCADDAYVSALRDGVLTFLLRPGDALAAPGTPLAQGWPALVMATALRGATLLHLEPQALERDPAQLGRLPLRSLGVTPALRDLLLRARLGPLKKVDHWFRNPEESVDHVEWQEFIAACGWQQLPHSNVLLDAAAGGAVLSSLRRRGSVHLEVTPGAGRPWQLLDVNRSGQEAAGDVGVFQLAPLPPPLQKAPRPPDVVVLARLGACEYLYGGTCEPRRDGRVYPAAEVIALVEELPGVAGAAVAVVPLAGAPGRSLFVLLVFVGAEPQSGELGAQVTDRLQRQLGPFFLPDRTEFVPLFPRRGKDGAVDQEWCRGQYARGALHVRATDRAFQLLTALRASTVEKRARRQQARAGA